MSMYYKGKLISGVREVPKMTLAQYNALTNKPDVWVRTDAPDSDRGISASDVEYSTGVSVEDKIDSVNTNLGSQLFFGANDGQHYSANKTSVDAIVDDVVQVSSGDNHGYFSVQNVGNITGYGNRQFLFGWINSQKNYGWVIIATYNNKISFGTRTGSSTFSIREL